MCIYMNVWVHVCVCMCLYVHMPICVYIYMCVYMFMCALYVCMYVVNMCVYVLYIFMCVCLCGGSMCICMCVWTCIPTRLESVCYNILGTLLSTRNTTVNKIYPHPLLHGIYNFSEIQFEDLETNSIWAYSGLPCDHLEANCCCKALVPTVACGRQCPGIK